MNNYIKKYELNDNITLDKLSKAKFEKGGWFSNVSHPKVSFFKILHEDIELHIEIPTSDLNNIQFDEDRNICVFDDEIGQPYYPFYHKTDRTDFINLIINRYNETMDSLVKEGIFKEKIIKK